MSVPILMYHHVLPTAGFISSSVAQFGEQMQWLVDHGWHTLDSATFRDYKLQRRPLPERSLLITFDDGWRDNLIYAYPILKALRLRATLFVVTGWIDAASAAAADYQPRQHKECKRLAPVAPRAVLLNWEELAAMQDVFDIHPHTHTHRDDYFGSLDWGEDLLRSRARIEAELGHRSTHLCWPRGVYAQEQLDLAQSIGFDMLYTTERGANVDDGDGRRLHRLAAKEGQRWLHRNLWIARHAPLARLYARFKPE